MSIEWISVDDGDPMPGPALVWRLGEFEAAFYSGWMYQTEHGEILSDVTHYAYITPPEGE